VLTSQVGSVFDGAIVSVEEKDPRRGVVMLCEHGVEAPVLGDSPLPLGIDVRVELAVAEVSTRTVEFRLV